MKSVKKQNRTGESLRKRGFDLTRYNSDEHCYTVGCFQCHALVINGIACHEHGCPNEVSIDRDKDR
jgi:hypothetical protein